MLTISWIKSNVSTFTKAQPNEFKGHLPSTPLLSLMKSQPCSQCTALQIGSSATLAVSASSSYSPRSVSSNKSHCSAISAFQVYVLNPVCILPSVLLLTYKVPKNRTYPIYFVILSKPYTITYECMLCNLYFLMKNISHLQVVLKLVTKKVKQKKIPFKKIAFLHEKNRDYMV